MLESRHERTLSLATFIHGANISLYADARHGVIHYEAGIRFEKSFVRIGSSGSRHADCHCLARDSAPAAFRRALELAALSAERLLLEKRLSQG
jgi:hypothetical protein